MEHWQFKPGIVGLVLGLISFLYFSKKHTITTIILLDRQPIEAVHILSIIVVYPSLLMSQTQLTPVWIAFSIVQTRSALGLVGSGLRDDIVDMRCFSSHPTIPFPVQGSGNVFLSSCVSRYTYLFILLILLVSCLQRVILEVETDSCILWRRWEKQLHFEAMSSFLSLLTIHIGYEASKKCVYLFVHLVVVRD